MSETAAPRAGRPRTMITVIVLVALAVAVGGGLWLRSALVESAADADAAAAPVLRLEAAAAEGDDPFTPSVAAPDHDVDAMFTDTIVARTVEITQQASTDD